MLLKEKEVVEQRASMMITNSRLSRRADSAQTSAKHSHIFQIFPPCDLLSCSRFCSPDVTWQRVFANRSALPR